MGARINYGQLNDVRLPISVLTGATVAFKNNGGKWVSGYGGAITLSSATSVAILGWAEVGEFTAAATDVITVNIAKDAIYEMPLAAAVTEAALQALVGKACDIVVTGGIQYANYAASTYGPLQIVGYSYYGSAAGEQTVWVRINPATSSGTITVTGVA